MGNPWKNEDGDVVHPDAPDGGGGPGRFRDNGPTGWTDSAPSDVPHPRSPSARYLDLTDADKEDAGRQPADAATGPPVDDPGLNQSVGQAANSTVGSAVVGDGECYALADQILKEAGAKSAPDFGKITDDANYQWGTKIDLKDVKAGDVLQFRDHEFTITTKTVKKKVQPNGARSTETSGETETHKRPHHTAIVSAVNSDGTLTLVEQHVIDPATKKRSKVVRQNILYLANQTRDPVKTHKNEGQTEVEIETTVTIEVTGRIWAYRPQRK